METVAIKTSSAHLTEEQFFQLCIQNRDLQFERDKNKNIFIMSPTGGFTGMHNLSIEAILWNWNHSHKHGYAFNSSTGFTLPNGAMRAPDAAWIAKDRWEKVPQNDKERFAHICPDFVIEVRSKSDSLICLQEKMTEWIENGCRLAWLIDLENKNVYIYKPDTKAKQQSFEKRLSGGDVLPGFELDLEAIMTV